MLKLAVFAQGLGCLVPYTTMNRSFELIAMHYIRNGQTHLKLPINEIYFERPINSLKQYGMTKTSMINKANTGYNTFELCKMPFIEQREKEKKNDDEECLSNKIEDKPMEKRHRHTHIHQSEVNFHSIQNEIVNKCKRCERMD